MTSFTSSFPISSNYVFEHEVNIYHQITKNILPILKTVLLFISPQKVITWFEWDTKRNFSAKGWCP